MAVLAGHGLSLAGQDAPDSATAETELYLEVVLNQFPTGHLARFVQREGRFFASASTLHELGLAWPGGEDASGLLALDVLPGLQVDYDASLQRMHLQVPVEMLDQAPVRLGFVPEDAPRPDPAMRAAGLVLNYDVQAQQSDHQRMLGGWTEMRVFGLGAGILSNTLNTRVFDNDGTSGRRHDSVRLDTSWQWDFPDRMLSLVLGDAITGAVPWTRPTRIGGLRLASNFSLQPYRTTAPLASFAGEAALPSTVDLLIDGIHQSSQQVAPGRFQIDSAPMLNGAGHAQLVVTDINGFTRTLDFALYGTPQLLEAGLSDWSLDLGWVRRAYGQESARYADHPMFSASLRRGVSDRLTLEAHGEGTAGLEMAGIGGVWMPSLRSGTFSAAFATSHSDEAGQGGQLGLGYQWQARGFTVSASTLRRDSGFRDVASLEGSLLTRRTDQVFAGVSTWVGQWNLGYVRQEFPDAEASRYLTAGWSRQFAHGQYLNLNTNRNLERSGDDNVFLSWSIPLDNRVMLSASARHSRDARNLALNASRSLAGDEGGWGWRTQAMLGDSRSGQAEISQLGRYGQWTAGLSHFPGGNDTAYAYASGGLLWMGGHGFAMRRVDDAFALVSTQGVAGVPIRLENRLIGQTDEHGLLLVNRLNAWQRNKLSIDPLAVAPDIRIDLTEMQAVPYSRSGLLARFPMRRVVSVQMAVHDTAGVYLPAGSPVWSGDADPAVTPALTVVGHDGVIFLDDPQPQARFRIRHDGGYCEIILPEVSGSAGFVELEGVVCR